MKRNFMFMKGKTQYCQDVGSPQFDAIPINISASYFIGTSF